MTRSDRRVGNTTVPKLIGLTSAAGIFLCFGLTVGLQAQRDQGDKQGNSDQQERGGPQRAQPQQRQQQKRQPQSQRGSQPQQQQPQRAQQPQRQQSPPSQRAGQPRQPQRQSPQQQPQQRAQQPQRAHPQRSQEQARAWQQQRGWQQRGGWQGQDSWERNRARNWALDHRTWTQRGGYGGFYIPQVSFGLYFGRQHYFRLHSRPVMYMGYPRFDYGGFSFLMVDPWPEYWPENWYDNDDLYIDYDDGYYLYHRRYPQVRLAVTIVL